MLEKPCQQIVDKAFLYVKIITVMFLQKHRIYSAVLSAMFSAIIIICSLISVPAPIPFTMQTFAIFTATAFLGFKGGLAAVGTYILLGAVGLPVFYGMQGGMGALLGPTGGYIIGFVFIPLISGLLSLVLPKRYKFVYMLLGLLACYLFGMLWYMLYTDADSFVAVLLVTVLPFVLPDLVKLFLALKLADVLKNACDKILPPSPDSLSKNRIKRYTSNKLQVFVFEEIDSTNSEAVRKLNEGISTPALFVAERQTAGRGRRGRSFYSDGGGLYMTLAVNCSAENSVGLTTLAAVAVAEAIENLTGISAKIKWVNDIYVRDKKVCGILCESVTDKQSGEMYAAIIGIGINLNVKEFPNELDGIAGNLGCNQLSKNLLAAHITNRILELIESDEEYISSYKQKSLVLGKEIFYIKNDVQYDAVAADITENGGLIVKNADGSTETLTSGEITLRIKKSE